jgi:hypothetical protein
MNARVRDGLFAFGLLATLAALVLLAARAAPWSMIALRETPPALRSALDALPNPLGIEAFARTDPALRATISQYFARFDQSVRFTDPDADPSRTRALGVKVDGEVVLTSGARSVRLRALDDAAFARAVASLSRERLRTIGLITPADDAAQFAQLRTALEADGERVLPIDLAAVGIPNALDALILVGGNLPIDSAQSFELQAFIERGGALLWLIESRAHSADEAALEPLANGYRELAQTLKLNVGARLVVAHPGANDARITVAPQRVALDPPLQRAVELNGAVALSASSDSRWQSSALLRTEDGASAGSSSVGQVARGALDVGLALLDAQRLKLIVVGDTDGWRNSEIGRGDNLAFARRALDLLAPSGAIARLDLEAPDARFTLTRSSALAFSAWLLVGLPGLCALIAIGLTLRRWRRR